MRASYLATVKKKRFSESSLQAERGLRNSDRHHFPPFLNLPHPPLHKIKVL